ncbi:hypothetical protein [Pseudomonas putida]|uniref:hypothetical protein n=1 Tax=Pseudomonas putida TaxID=303 RepID=UPI0023657E49|nr:hypothetical protein [Pseudomonas putida]MDD2048328.1 hypothetical protein [Pseudomonas putida]
MDDLDEKIAAGEPLMLQAMDAIRQYHEARDSLTPAEEVERLRLKAASLFEAIQEYQLRIFGGPIHPHV